MFSEVAEKVKREVFLHSEIVDRKLKLILNQIY